MVDVFSIATQCSTPLQVIGLLIIAVFFISIAFIAYITIRYIGRVILSYRRAEVNIDKGDTHIDAHLSR